MYYQNLRKKEEVKISKYVLMFAGFYFLGIVALMILGIVLALLRINFSHNLSQGLDMGLVTLAGLWVAEKFVKTHRRPFTPAEKRKIWLGCWGVWIFFQVGLSLLFLPFLHLQIGLTEFLILASIPILASGLALSLLFGPVARKRAEHILKKESKNIL